MTPLAQSLSLGEPEQIFPLENGDHLTRDEFERRYHAMPHQKKAELKEWFTCPHRLGLDPMPDFMVI